MLFDVIFEDLHPHVWVVYRLHSVPDAHDQLSFLLHLVHELHGDNTTVKGFAEHLGSCIQGTPKPVPNSEQPRGKAGNQVLSSPSTDNGVVSPRYGRPMICSHHQAHLDELAGIFG